MRYVWLVFVGLVAAMVFVLPRFNKRATPAVSVQASPAMPVQRTASFTELPEASAPGPAARADSIVAFGLAQQGTPYVYAGTSPLTGFDCSGFIMYTFAHFNVAVPHSTALLIDVGRPVARDEAQPGDIVVFTGTATTSTTPGHAGIVISRRGETPLRFVHASSARREPFVKVSHVEGTDYERRFMQVRRVLGPGEVATTRPKQPIPARMAAPVAALRTRRVAVAPDIAPVPALPQKLAPKKAARRAVVKKHVAAKAAVSKKKTVAKATASKNLSKKKAPVAKQKAVAKRLSAKKRTTR